MSKYVFFTAGVVSGLGKGITAASLGMLIKARGYSVNIIKFDPYFNVDAQYISPYQHGEVFVTDDGGEADSVVGHYERFLNQNLNSNCDITSGRIYSDVIDKSRRGKYNGSTVQIVPHITDEIKDRIYAFNSDDTDVVICEIGGIVGDIESHPYLEAIRQCRNELGRGNAIYVHMALVPYIEKSGEQKTKPTQNSVKELQNIGIQPDIIVCRSDYPLGDSAKTKLSLFCNVDKNSIIESITSRNVYRIPVRLEAQNFAGVALSKLKLDERTPDLEQWLKLSTASKQVSESVRSTKIALVGKYTEKMTAYQSLMDALYLAAIDTRTPIDLKLVPSEKLAKDSSRLSEFDGIVIAAGFGERGFDGKAAAAKYARENSIPCLMIGLGAQAGLVEFARNVCGFEDAASQEFNSKTEHAVVYRPNQDYFKRGGFISNLDPTSKLAAIYGTDTVKERHRHKYAFNGDFAADFESHGLKFVAHSHKTNTPEAFELVGEKFYIGVIYRPEFTSRPLAPHPLFNAFINAAGKSK